MKIFGFPKESYSKELLEQINQKYFYELACDDEAVILLEDIKDFQDYLNSNLNHSNDFWWFFF